MYINTPRNEAIELVQKALNSQAAMLTKSDIKKPPTEYLIKMLSLILKQNTFEFNNEFYKQTHGCSMGSNASPEIAEITFHELEMKIISNYQHQIHFLKRFRG